MRLLLAAGVLAGIAAGALVWKVADRAYGWRAYWRRLRRVLIITAWAIAILYALAWSLLYAG